MSYELIKQIPEQPLAIIGDIHGEFDAMENLLEHLSKSIYSNHRLLFIGDLCDRGPKSVSVINKVKQLLESNKAYAILGNHEINLLSNDAKDGSGWYFPIREDSDNNYYYPYEYADINAKKDIFEFFNSLPIAIQMDSLNVVHAAWEQNSIDKLKQAFNNEFNGFVDVYDYWHKYILAKAQENHLKENYLKQKKEWSEKLEDPEQTPPYLEYIAQFEALEQTHNPIKRITSGIEEPSKKPFFSGNRWRFSDRTSWWNNYDNKKPVIIGHYWRLFNTPIESKNWRYSALFSGIEPLAWHGRYNQVYCIDYSVGARWRDRKQGININNSRYKLAAMLWPEKKVMFDDGLLVDTLY